MHSKKLCIHSTWQVVTPYCWNEWRASRVVSQEPWVRSTIPVLQMRTKVKLLAPSNFVAKWPKWDFKSNLIPKPIFSCHVSLHCKPQKFNYMVLSLILFLYLCQYSGLGGSWNFLLNNHLFSNSSCFILRHICQTAFPVNDSSYSALVQYLLDWTDRQKSVTSCCPPIQGSPQIMRIVQKFSVFPSPPSSQYISMAWVLFMCRLHCDGIHVPYKNLMLMFR